AEGRHRLTHFVGAQPPAGDSEAPQADFPSFRIKRRPESNTELLQSQYIRIECRVPILNSQRLSDGRRIQNAILDCQPNVAPVASTARSVELVVVVMHARRLEYEFGSECSLRTDRNSTPLLLPTNSLYLALEFALKQAPSSADLSTPNWSSMAKVRGSNRLCRPLLKSNAATRPSTCGGGDADGGGGELPSDASVLHTNLCLLWHLSLRSRPADSVTQFTVQSALSGEAGVQLDEAEPHRVEQLCRLAAVDSEAELVHKVQLRLGEHRRQLRRVSLAVEVGLVEVGLKLRHHVALLVVQPPAAGTSALRPPPQVDETAGVGAQLAHKRVPLVIQRVEPPLTVTSDQRLVNAVQLREVVSLEAPYAAAVRPPVACRVGQTVEVGAEQTDPGVSAVRQSAYQSVLLLTLDGRELSPALRVGIYPLELLLECVEGVESRQIEWRGLS
uniref:ZP domain-containing protein n=1 Tax=Macrostomum lignano TaxID=282301 RepID=A0A1I8IQC4_9PLAT